MIINEPSIELKILIAVLAFTIKTLIHSHRASSCCWFSLEYNLEAKSYLFKNCFRTEVAFSPPLMLLLGHKMTPVDIFQLLLDHYSIIALTYEGRVGHFVPTRDMEGPTQSQTIRSGRVCRDKSRMISWYLHPSHPQMMI